MRVRVKQPISGMRDGVAWPSVGSVVELPDDEAREMLKSGSVGAVDESDTPEPVVKVPDDTNEAVEKFIPETARHEPSIGVENLPPEDRRPVMGNVGLTDDGEMSFGPTSLPTASDEPVDMVAASKAVDDTSKSTTPASTSKASTSRATTPSKSADTK